VDKLLKTKIPLPVDKNNEPDWLWIENHSKKIFSKVKENIYHSTIISIERERERESKSISVLKIGMKLRLTIISMLKERKSPKKKTFQQENLLI
jgi:hypothetical protein